MTALLWTRSPTVFDTFYAGRVVRFVAWICPRCDRRGRTVVHRGPVTEGPNGQPMSREEIAREYGAGSGSLSWALGLVPGDDDEPTWSFGLDSAAPAIGGFVPVSCGVCCQRVILSQYALSPTLRILERLRRGDPMIPYHDPLGSAWDAHSPDGSAEVYL